MIGTNMEELKQYLKSNREIEFFYQNSVYTIEPGEITSNTRLFYLEIKDRYGHS